MHETAPMTPQEIDPATQILLAAFADDVMWSALIPDAEERHRIMPILWRGVLTYCHRYGFVSTAGSPVYGVAAWTCPGHAHPTPWKLLRAGFLLPRTAMLMSKRTRNRFIHTMEQVEQLHRQLMPQPHYYLWALGVDPPHQGQGIGGQLLEAGLARAQDTHHACYLETQTKSNVTFYRKRGFDVLQQADFSALGLHLWFLRKMPAQIGDHQSAK